MIYDINFYEKTLRQNSATAEFINFIRWDWVEQCHAKTVLDYGCGAGWFRAFRRNGATVDSFDIMPVPQTGINHNEYDLVCFWDVIEHLPDLAIAEDLIRRSRYTAMTIPIMPDDVELKTWKHYKPGEHLHYFTVDGIHDWMRNLNRKLIKVGQPECPPRTDVWSFLYEKDSS